MYRVLVWGILPQHGRIKWNRKRTSELEAGVYVVVYGNEGFQKLGASWAGGYLESKASSSLWSMLGFTFFMDANMSQNAKTETKSCPVCAAEEYIDRGGSGRRWTGALCLI